MHHIAEVAANHFDFIALDTRFPYMIQRITDTVSFYVFIIFNKSHEKVKAYTSIWFFWLWLSSSSLLDLTIEPKI